MKKLLVLLLMFPFSLLAEEKTFLDDAPAGFIHLRNTYKDGRDLYISTKHIIRVERYLPVREDRKRAYWLTLATTEIKRDRPVRAEGGGASTSMTYSISFKNEKDAIWAMQRILAIMGNHH